eukprot:m.61612 g.61612  ORF g.61612 m.61612 type:complete len:410 (-) comp13892_c0_seq2:73-1302(-)
MASLIRPCHLGRFARLAQQSTQLAAMPLHREQHKQSQTATALPFITVGSQRYLSTESATQQTTVMASNNDYASASMTDTAAALVDGAIPSTTTTDTALAIVDNTVHIGEVVDAGLGGMTPVGLVQQLVEFTSAMGGLPWVGGIVATTVLMRTIMLPVVFGSMRNNTKLMNLQPEMQLHSGRMRECQTRNDHEGASRAAANLQALFKEHNVHPLKGLLPLVLQAPVFISFFMALRGMATLPLESMQHGGALWFPDLTAADPYYILPVTASLTMLATIELGSEGVKQQNSNMKNIFRVLSVAMLPVTISFPTAIFVYWCTANFFSLGQVALLKIPGLKGALGIPEMIQHPAMPKQPSFKDEFMSGVKAVVDKQKQASEQPNVAPPRVREATGTATATRKPSRKKGRKSRKL